MGAVLAREIHGKHGRPSRSLRSSHGATPALSGPDEFGYFWRHWFGYDNPESHELTRDDLAGIDADGLGQQLRAVESVFEAPLLLKNPSLFSLNIAGVPSIIPKALLIVCERESVYVAQSTLQMREQRLNTREPWYGPKPREYSWLRHLAPLDQVAGQVHFTRCRVEEGLAQLNPRRYLRVKYEDLCRNPQSQLRVIADWIQSHGSLRRQADCDPEPLQSTNRRNLSVSDFAV